MGQDSKIEWTTHTFNPWWGCTKISAGCDHCYAETFDRRVGGHHWGKGAERRTFGDKHWLHPLKWNAAAEKAGTRARVFCASMADVFDAEAPAGQLDRLWSLIRLTPQLDWLLLTKRAGRIQRSLPADWGQGYANVWLGVSVEDQEQADQRVPLLLSTPARVRFLSLEPLLGPVDLQSLKISPTCEDCGQQPLADALGLAERCGCTLEGAEPIAWGRLHWAIVGGESGPGARPFDLAWARSLVTQLQCAGAAPFVKQLGAVPVMAEAEWHALPKVPLLSARNHGRAPAGTVPLHLEDMKGGDWNAWPSVAQELRVREFPAGVSRG